MRRIIFTFLCLLPALTCQARTIIIDANGSGDYPTIQQAIDDSNHSDTIILTPGTYTGTGNRDIDFKGLAITVRSVDPNDPNIIATTIIDCNGNSAEPHRGFYFHSVEDANSVLEGFTITNGYASGSWPDYNGGGIYCVGSSPTITNCTISGSSAYDGGGMCNSYNSSPKLTNCTFSRNSAKDDGGGMCNISKCNLVLKNCTFHDNSAKDWAGGMFNYNSNPSVEDCTFSANSAKRGGGMHNYQSRPTVEDCTFSANQVERGGGIYNTDSNPIVKDCIFSGNSASFYGGGMYNWFSSPAVEGCTFASNMADRYGIGMFNYHSRSRPTVVNCIFWDDTTSEIYGGTPTVTFSNVQDGWEGLGNIDADPCFVSPGYWVDANDPNIIVEPNDPNATWIEGDYHLYPFSLCINAGDPNYLPEPNETDLDGNPRIIAGRIDMGAYEANHMESQLWILPRVINRQSRQKRIMTWLRLPQGITKDQIDSNVPLLLYPGQIEPTRQYIFQRGRRERKRTSIIAFFDKSDLMAAVPNGPVELWAVGQLKTGRYFFGSDTVRIISRPRRPWRH